MISTQPLPIEQGMHCALQSLIVNTTDWSSPPWVSLKADCTTAQRLHSLEDSTARLHAICCSCGILVPGDVNIKAYQIAPTSTDTSTS